MPFSDKDQDSFIFCTFVILGGVFLFLSSWFSLWGQAVVGCVLVAAYGVFIYRSSKTLDQQKADSCYFLGFIYTLIALMFSLYQISSHSSEGAAQEINQLIGLVLGSVAFALSTTVVGLLGRVILLNLMPAETTEAENLARDTLDNAVRSFMGQLKRAMGEVETFMKGLDKLPEVSDMMNKRIDAFKKEFLKVKIDSDEINRKIMGPFEELNKSISENIEGIPRQIRNSLNSVVQGMEDIEIDTTSLQNVTSQIEESLAPLNATIKKLDEKTKGLEKNMGSAAKKTEGFGDNLTKAGDYLNTLNNSLEDLATNMKDTKGNIKTYSTEMNKLSKELTRQVKTTPGLGKKLTAAIEKLAKDMNSESEKLLDSITASNDNLKQYEEHIKKLYANLTKASEVLSQEFKSGLQAAKKRSN